MTIKELYNNIPNLVRSFLIKALVILVVWKLLYGFVLEPARIPDKFLVNITGYSTQILLSFFYKNVSVDYITSIDIQSAIVNIDGKKVIGIADPCNGLDVYVLFLSFLYCFPGSWKKRGLYVIIGLPYIYIINTIRCGLIAWLNISHKGWVDISHHYLFTAAVYILVFLVWMRYTKNTVVHE